MDRMEHNASLPCPSCGFITIEDNYYGTHDTCPVCNWEDDHIQLANPACKGASNSISLIESQKRTLKKVPLELKEYKDFIRDNRWRPLNIKELERFEKEKRKQRWMNKGVISVKEVYWTKNKKS